MVTAPIQSSQKHFRHRPLASKSPVRRPVVHLYYNTAFTNLLHRTSPSQPGEDPSSSGTASLHAKASLPSTTAPLRKFFMHIDVWLHQPITPHPPGCSAGSSPSRRLLRNPADAIAALPSTRAPCSSGSSPCATRSAFAPPSPPHPQQGLQTITPSSPPRVLGW